MYVLKKIDVYYTISESMSNIHIKRCLVLHKNSEMMKTILNLQENSLTWKSFGVKITSLMYMVTV
jgi:hypothetical protein